LSDCLIQVSDKRLESR